MVVRKSDTGEAIMVFKTNSDLELEIVVSTGESYKIRKITESQFLTLRDILNVEESGGPEVIVDEAARDLIASIIDL